MHKSVLTFGLLLLVIGFTSCRKTLNPVSSDEMSFMVRLPSVSIARFEVRCVTDDIYLDQVIIQSPSAEYYTIDFDHVSYARDEAFLVGNYPSEDGTWLITFAGIRVITDAEFRKTVPYEMYLGIDDNEE